MNTQIWKTYTGARENLHPFRFAFLFSGFTFGVMAYLLLGVGLGYSGRNSILLGAISGVVFGLLIGLICYVLDRVSPERKWLMVAAGLMFGGLAGAGIAWVAYTYIPSPKYEVIPTAPKQPASILAQAKMGYLDGEFYINTEVGQFYGYACSYGFACNWREVVDPSVYPLSPSIGFPDVNNLELGADQIVDGQKFVFVSNGVEINYSIVLSSAGDIYTRIKVNPGIALNVLLLTFVVIGTVCGVSSPILILRDQKKTY